MKLIEIESEELKNLEKTKSEKIKETFNPMVEMLEGFEKDFDNLISESKKEITQELTVKAKRLRLDISKVRIETGKLKDKQKEYIKLEDKAIMGVHNIVVWAVKEKEDKLKEIETHFEALEAKRLKELQLLRVEELSKYIEDAHERTLNEMDEDVWGAYLSTKKKEYEDRIEAEKQAEKSRIEREKAEAIERERIRKENERLKKEAEVKEKRNQELRPYIVFIRDYDELLNMPEKDFLKSLEDIKKGAEDHWEHERKQQIKKQKEEEKAKKERDQLAKKLQEEKANKEKLALEEKKKREKLEAELKAKVYAENEARIQEEKRIQAELNKGDKAKVNDLIKDLGSLKTKYTFKSKKNQKMYSDVSLLIEKVVNHIGK